MIGIWYLDWLTPTKTYKKNIVTVIAGKTAPTLGKGGPVLILISSNIVR
jgi:hypothetical protein